MNWVISTQDDAFNLDNIAHIWIQKCPNGYFLMGEMIHNQEEVVLSSTFDNIERVRQLRDDLFPNKGTFLDQKSKKRFN